MPHTMQSLAHLSDSELIAEVARLAERERHATAALVASLAEVDARRLYLREGYSSLFTYCTQRLHLSEHAAYRRIEAARGAARFPLLLERLASGSITLTAIGLVLPHLTADNHPALLDQAHHRSKRELEELVARLSPRPDVPTSLRKLPQRQQAKPVSEGRPSAASTAASGQAAPASIALPPVVECRAGADAAPLVETRCDVARSAAARSAALGAPSAMVQAIAPQRYRLQITLSAETHAKLRRAQDLLRHAVPNGDPAAVVERALTLLVQHLERTTFAAKRDRPARGRRRRPSQAAAKGGPSSTEAPVKAASRRHASRHIPAAVRRAVWIRDGGQCAFLGREGRCSERGFLEFHHRVPFADGGGATVDNIELRCRAHNAFEAAEHYACNAAARSGPS